MAVLVIEPSRLLDARFDTAERLVRLRLGLQAADLEAWVDFVPGAAPRDRALDAGEIEAWRRGLFGARGVAAVAGDLDAALRRRLRFASADFARWRFDTVDVVHAETAFDAVRVADALRRARRRGVPLLLSPPPADRAAELARRLAHARVDSATAEAMLAAEAWIAYEASRVAEVFNASQDPHLDAAEEACLYLERVTVGGRRLRPSVAPAAEKVAPIDAPAPAVSIIVPVFNVAPYLDACLAHLSAQTLADLEIILVDDASTDASAALLHRWAWRDRRMRVLHRPHRGLSAARNAGLDVARGRWIAFVDSDDLPRADFAEHLLAAVTTTGAALACCAIEYLHPDGALELHSTLHAWERVAPVLQDGVIDLTDKRVLLQFFPSAWNKIYRRDLFETLRFPEGLNYEDHVVFFRIGMAVDRCAYVDEPLYRQRLGRPGAITIDRSERNFDVFPVLRRIFAELPEPVRTSTPGVFKQLALRLCWERANLLPDRRDFARFCAEAHALLVETATLDCAPEGEDAWIPSAFAWRVQLPGPPPAAFVSVVVTFADDALHIGALLDDLAAQTLRDFEAILVDNGSRDGAAAIAAARCAEDERFTCLHHAGGALGAARNAGLDAARGEHVAFFEANDLLRVDALERLFGYAEDAAADVAVCAFEYVSAERVDYHAGAHRRLAAIEEGPRPAKFILADEGLGLLADFLATPCNKLFRRAFLVDRAVRFETEGFFEEHAFWCDVALARPRVSYTSEPLYRVREEATSRRVWRQPWYALDATTVLRRLAVRLTGARRRELLAKLAVRLAWERLSFALYAPAARRAFARAWRDAVPKLDAATLLAARDEYIGAEFVHELLALAGAPAAPTQHAILVVGMHRSGTSAATRVLNLLGATLPRELIDAGHGNELGLWEPAHITALHDRMLAAAGSDWADVVGPDPAWFDSPEAQGFVDEVADFLAREFDGVERFVIKDPRLALFVPVWRRALARLKIQAHFVLPFRDPIEVAQSLGRRERVYTPERGWGVERGALLWLRYVLSAERATREDLRTFVRFDALIEDWRREAARIFAQLGLAEHAAADAASRIDAYLRADERHEHVEALERPPREIDEGLVPVLQALDTCVASPFAERAVFDAAWSILEAGRRTYGPLLRVLETSNATSTAACAEARRQAEALQAEITVAGVHAAQREAALEARMADAAARAADDQAATRQAHGRDVEALQGQLARAEAAAQSAAAAVEALERDVDALRGEVRAAASAASRDAERLARGEACARTVMTERDALQTALQTRISALELEEEALRRENSALRSSTSWKLTAPLRRLRSTGSK